MGRAYSVSMNDGGQDRDVLGAPNGKADRTQETPAASLTTCVDQPPREPGDLGCREPDRCPDFGSSGGHLVDTLLCDTLRLNATD